MQMLISHPNSYQVLRHSAQLVSGPMWLPKVKSSQWLSDCQLMEVSNFAKFPLRSIPSCALALDKRFRWKKSIPVFSTWTSLGYCENLPWRSWYWDSKVKLYHNSTEAMILPQILRSTNSCSPLWRAPLWASRGTNKPMTSCVSNSISFSILKSCFSVVK